MPIPAPTPLLTALFVAIVFALVFALLRATFAAGGPAGEPAARTRRWVALTAAGMLAWVGVTGVLAARGLLNTDAPLPAPFHRLMLLSALATGAFAFLAPGRRLVAGVPLWKLCGFQAFRVPLEFVLWALYANGSLPVQMTYEGRNFDVLSGLLAIPLAFFLRRGRVPSGVIWAWNLLSLGLLVNIVQIAVRSTPGPLRAFTNDPPNVLVFSLPWVWLPTICVLAALLGHLLVFRGLLAQKPNSSTQIPLAH
ncbi:MAG: hypothetical protein EXR77_15460 [Myxococcales bacterium]|nr:hypothetical protein [Myxococcales bacterium]